MLSLDQFGQQITLTQFGKSRHQTWLGTACTLVVYPMLFVIYVNYILVSNSSSYFDAVIEKTIQNSDGSPLSLSHHLNESSHIKNIQLRFAVLDETFDNDDNPFGKFEVQFLTNNGSQNKQNVISKSVPVDVCLSQTNDLRYGGKNIKELCPIFNDNSFIQGSFQSTHFTWLSLTLSLCDNSASSILQRQIQRKKYVKCASDQSQIDYFSQTLVKVIVVTKSPDLNSNQKVSTQKGIELKNYTHIHSISPNIEVGEEANALKEVQKIIKFGSISADKHGFQHSIGLQKGRFVRINKWLDHLFPASAPVDDFIKFGSLASDSVPLGFTLSQQVNYINKEPKSDKKQIIAEWNFFQEDGVSLTTLQKFTLIHSAGLVGGLIYLVLLTVTCLFFVLHYGIAKYKLMEGHLNQMSKSNSLYTGTNSAFFNANCIKEDSQLKFSTPPFSVRVSQQLLFADIKQFIVTVLTYLGCLSFEPQNLENTSKQIQNTQNYRFNEQNNQRIAGLSEGGCSDNVYTRTALEINNFISESVKRFDLEQIWHISYIENLQFELQEKLMENQELLVKVLQLMAITKQDLKLQINSHNQQNQSDKDPSNKENQQVQLSSKSSNFDDLQIAQSSNIDQSETPKTNNLSNNENLNDKSIPKQRPQAAFVRVKPNQISNQQEKMRLCDETNIDQADEQFNQLSKEKKLVQKQQKHSLVDPTNSNQQVIISNLESHGDEDSLDNYRINSGEIQLNITQLEQKQGKKIIQNEQNRLSQKLDSQQEQQQAMNNQIQDQKRPKNLDKNEQKVVQRNLKPNSQTHQTNIGDNTGRQINDSYVSSSNIKFDCEGSPGAGYIDQNQPLNNQDDQNSFDENEEENQFDISISQQQLLVKQQPDRKIKSQGQVEPYEGLKQTLTTSNDSKSPSRYPVKLANQHIGINDLENSILSHNDSKANLQKSRQIQHSKSSNIHQSIQNQRKQWKLQGANKFLQMVGVDVANEQSGAQEGHLEVKKSVIGPPRQTIE